MKKNRRVEAPGNGNPQTIEDLFRTVPIVEPGPAGRIPHLNAGRSVFNTRRHFFKGSLALRADAEKFQAVRNAFETGGARDAVFDFGWKAVSDLHHFRAGAADE